MSCEFTTDTKINVWKDLEDIECSKSWTNLIIKSSLSKQEKKQLRKNLIGDIKKEIEVIPAEKQKVYDEQRAKEIEKLKEAKIRIEKQEEMEKS